MTGIPAEEEAEIQSEAAKVSKDGYLELSGVHYNFQFSIFNFQFNLVPLQRLMPYAGQDDKKQFMEVAGNQCDK